jgi:uncharacterized protein (DUF2147 family)
LGTPKNQIFRRYASAAKCSFTQVNSAFAADASLEKYDSLEFPTIVPTNQIFRRYASAAKCSFTQANSAFAADASLEKYDSLEFPTIVPTNHIFRRYASAAKCSFTQVNSAFAADASLEKYDSLELRVCQKVARRASISIEIVFQIHQLPRRGCTAYNMYPRRGKENLCTTAFY